MSTTTLPLSIGVTELTLADGSVTELVMSSVVDNKPYYDLAFAAAKVYTDAQDVVTLDAAKAFATAADGVVQAHVIQRINHTGTQPVGTITGLAAVATSGLKIDVGLGNVDNTSDVNKPVSTAQATADTNTLNSAKSYSDSGDTTTLNSAKSYADSLVVGLFDFRGDYNASGNTYPTSVDNGSGSAGAVLKADVWRIGTQGTLQGKTARVGDLLTSVIDSPGQIDANWTLTANELAYIPENTANKATDLSSNDSTHYPTTAAVQTAINTREPSITADVETKFWSGTKTFRDLATDVRVVVLTGLSTATGTAITAADTILSALGKLQNQASTNATAITGKEPTITATTSADYYRGDKTFVSFATTVRATVLTGLSTATGTVITATDTVLSALGSLQNQITNKTVDTLGNVTITAKASNDMLKWDGTISKWVNIPIPVGTAGTSLSRKTTSISSSIGTLTIDLSGGYEIFNVTLTENITTITITNPPASGFTAEFAIVFTQAAGAYTIVNPASGKVHGGFSPISSVNGAVESWGFRVNSSGTVIGVFQSGVQA